MKVRSLVVAIAIGVASYQAYKMYDNKRSYDEQFVQLVSSNSEPFKIIPAAIKPLSFMSEHAVMDAPTLIASKDGSSNSKDVELHVDNLVVDSETLSSGKLNSYNLVGLKGRIFNVPVNAQSARVQWADETGQVMLKGVELTSEVGSEYLVGDATVSKSYFDDAYIYSIRLESIGFELVLRSDSDVTLNRFVSEIQDIAFQKLRLTMQLPKDALALPLLTNKLAVIELLQKSLNNGEDPRSQRLNESLSELLASNERLTVQLSPQRPVSLVQVKSLMELPSLKMTEFLGVNINATDGETQTEQFDYPTISFD
ncbi:hypothetical protein AB6D11_03150 [Vibrio splendidus]